MKLSFMFLIHRGCTDISKTFDYYKTINPYLKYVDENDGRKLAWLPRELPSNVKMVVSTLPDDHYECFKQLKRVIHPECFLEVTVKRILW